MNEKIMMLRALEAAARCAESDDVPVGAVLFRGEEIVAVCGNARERDGDATQHAEIAVIREACRKLGRWRLSDCEMAVTLEPCPMCAGAIVNARIPKIIVGAKDPKGGAFGSVVNLNAYPLNHKVEVVFGEEKEECEAVLKEFFQKKRKN